MYRIDHCVAGCMTRYLPREKLSPAEAKEVPRAKPEVLPRLPSMHKLPVCRIDRLVRFRFLNYSRPGHTVVGHERTRT